MNINTTYLIIGALIGTAVMFLWGATEWFNPILQQPYRQVNDQTAVNATLIDNLSEDGIYVWHKDTQLHLGGTSELAEKDQQVMYFIAKNNGTYYQPGRFMLFEVLTQFFTWLLLTFLILRLRITSHQGRIGFVVSLGVLVGLAYFVPMWNWWGFSTDFTVIRWGNLLLGWLLAGTALSYYLKNKLA